MLDSASVGAEAARGGGPRGGGPAHTRRPPLTDQAADDGRAPPVGPARSAAKAMQVYGVYGSSTRGSSRTASEAGGESELGPDGWSSARGGYTERSSLDDASARADDRVRRHASDSRLWRQDPLSWRANRQLQQELTVLRVAQRLEEERAMQDHARQLRARAAAQASMARQLDPGEWRKGERGWRAHMHHVQVSAEARAAERKILEQQERLKASVQQVNARSMHEETRSTERRRIREHQREMGAAREAASRALAAERMQTRAAQRQREKERLRRFEANVTRKRLGLPRLPNEAEGSRGGKQDWDELGLTRVRPSAVALAASSALPRLPTRGSSRGSAAGSARPQRGGAEGEQRGNGPGDGEPGGGGGRGGGDDSLPPSPEHTRQQPAAAHGGAAHAAATSAA